MNKKKKVKFIQSKFLICSLFVVFVLLLSFYLISTNLATKESEELSSGINNDMEEINTETDTATYRVREGDTLESIANEYGLQKESIKWANNLRTDTVRPGQTLDIPPMDGIYVTVQEGDTLESIAKEYSVSDQDIADFNWLEYPFALEVGEVIFIPGGRKIE